MAPSIATPGAISFKTFPALCARSFLGELGASAVAPENTNWPYQLSKLGQTGIRNRRRSGLVGNTNSAEFAVAAPCGNWSSQQ
jgi:hypothetical protein